MGRGIRSWAKTAAFPLTIPVAVIALHRTPGCGFAAHLVDSLLLASQALVILGIPVAVTLGVRMGGSRGGRVGAPERQASPAMDDWDPPDRPTPGGEEYEAEDGPNVEGRFALLLFVVAAALFGVVLATEGLVPRDCVRGIFWIVF